MSKIRVLIADDHGVLRAGIRLLIDSQADMEVVGEAANCHDAARLTRELTPDVLTMDLTMPGSSIKTIERLREVCPLTQIVVLTMHDEASYLRSALAAGCSGYVAKSGADSELLSAIRAVHRGRIFVELAHQQGMVPTLLGDAGPHRRGKEGDALSDLSRRERQVLELLGQGYTNQEAADRLFLSVKTVETYRSRISEKLGLRSRADFVRLAVELGLIGPGKGTSSDDDL